MFLHPSGLGNLPICIRGGCKTAGNPSSSGSNDYPRGTIWVRLILLNQLATSLWCQQTMLLFILHNWSVVIFYYLLVGPICVLPTMACPLLLASRLGKSQKRWHSVLKVLFQNKLAWLGSFWIHPAPIVLIYYFAMQIVSLDQIATGYPLVNAFLRLLLWETVAPILQQWVEELAVSLWLGPTTRCLVDESVQLGLLPLSLTVMLSLFYKCCFNILPALTRNWSCYCS